MFEDELRHRVRRIATGDYRTEDVDRLFLGLRDRACVRDSVREVGDFIAHRALREKGLLTRQAKDVFLSFRSWLNIRSGGSFTVADIRKVAEANLRTATPDQLKRRTGLSKQVARAVLEQALRKLEAPDPVEATRRERRAVDYLGGAFIWNPAFTDVSLLDDLVYVLTQNRLLEKADAAPFRQVRDFLALHVITIMHGSMIVLEDGARAALRAGCDNNQGFLEVKAVLQYDEFAKPVRMPFCLFWTSLVPAQHCAVDLLTGGAWTRPLEIRGGKLVEMA